MNAWKVILAALVIYVAGIVTGNFASGLAKGTPEDSQGQQSARPRPPRMHDLVRRMESRLHLESEQTEKVRKIVEASQERMRTLNDELRPKFETESQSMRLEIEALLSEEQLAKFDEVFERSGIRPSRGPGGRGPGGRGQGGGGRRGEGRFDRGSRGNSELPGGPGGPGGNRPQRPALEQSQAPAPSQATSTLTDSPER
ncbi:hypothetical protein OAG52_00595 [Verrucomicrobia bacterium]|nr:hypothetical protein [Verrucomicrobiota bacterium]